MRGVTRAGACLAVLLVPASMACRDASRASTAARIDTLPSGIIHISNPLPEAGAPDFELIEDLRIGRIDGEGPDVFGEIWDLEVDSRGRIHVLDVSANEVRVFDAEGRHLWTAGREGRGPGELSYPVGLALDEQERVWVVDAGNGRYSVFEDGELVEERVRHVVAGVVPWKGGFDATGRLWDSYGLFGLAEGDLVGMVALDEQLLPTDSLLAGRVEEEVFETPVGRGATRAHVPFTPWIAWSFDPRGYLFVGDAAAYVIRQLSSTGDTIRIIRRAFEPVRVQPAELDWALADLEDYRARGGVVEPSRIPGEKPAFRALFVGTDARLWTLLHADGDALEPGPDETRFDVFAESGVHLGVARARSRLEPYRPPPVFTRTHVYAAAINDLGVQHVVRLRVEVGR